MATNSRDEFVQQFINRVFGAIDPLPRVCLCAGMHTETCPVVLFKVAAIRLGGLVADVEAANGQS